MCNYPLYDIPWLVREPNEKYNSQKRYLMERKNQAVVDTYFILRDQGLPAIEAQRQTAQKHQITTKQVYNILRWFFHEAKKQKKIRFFAKICTLRGTHLTLSYYLCTVFRKNIHLKHGRLSDSRRTPQQTTNIKLKHYGTLQTYRHGRTLQR